MGGTVRVIRGGVGVCVAVACAVFNRSCCRVACWGAVMSVDAILVIGDTSNVGVKANVGRGAVNTLVIGFSFVNG